MAVNDAVSSKKICDGKKFINKIMSIKSLHGKSRKKIKAALLSIVKTICLCGKQGIALYGKTDSRINIIALFDFRSEHDTILCEHMT